MKKLILVLFLFFILAGFVTAEVFEANIEGFQIKLLNINLKKQFSDPMGASSPNKLLNLADGLTAEDLGSLNIEAADQDAYEMSFDFENVKIPVKAWATDGSGNYYFTTASGLGESTSSSSGNWTGYDYWDAPVIDPGRTDGRVVIQSYFPEAAFIEAGGIYTVTSLVDLDYSVLFWDGLNAIGPFLNNASEFPSGTKAFGISAPDIVLALDTELTVERYAMASTSAALSSSDLSDYKVVSLFFDTSDQSLYDGAVKKDTGYSASIPGIQRAGAAARNSNGSYNLTFARNYSEADGVYIFDATTDNTFTRSSAGDAVKSMTMSDPSSGTSTVYYKRISD